MALDSETRPAPRRWRAKIEEIFGADLRSLAAFRIVLAVIVLADVIGRSGNLVVHYTDEGAFPRRAALLELDEWQVSVNLINGTPLAQSVLFAVTAVAAAALLVGVKTRVASVVLWFMVLSLHWRNPFVLSAADTLLRVLLFWAMFLPLGARWSLDRLRAAAGPRVPTRAVSVATAALFLQIAFVYWFTAILKSGDEWRSDGTALYYALSAQHVTTDIGTYLTRFPGLLKLLTFATLGLEAFAPFLLFSPVYTSRLRIFAVAAFVGLHAGIFLTMTIGYFPVLSAFCMVCFLPGRVWDAAERSVRSLASRIALRSPHVGHLRPRPGLAHRMPFATLAHAWSGPGQMHPAGVGVYSGVERPGSDDGDAVQAEDRVLDPATTATTLRARPFTNAMVSAFLLFALARNVASVSDFAMPESLRPIGYLTGLNQGWTMFAPRPYVSTHWYVIPGTLRDGRQFDLTEAVVRDEASLAKPVSWERPSDMNEVFADKYWRKYLDDMEENGTLRRSFAAFVCRTWNADHGGPDKLVSLEVVQVSERTLPNRAHEMAERDVVVERTCD